MSPENFVYWLQGFIELNNPVSINEEQTQQIKDHLKLVFDKKTPISKIDASFDFLPTDGILPGIVVNCRDFPQISC